MSAIPFTLIEGSMALPRMRPLGRHLPAPFGRDWAYRSPGCSLRIELKALYAAVIHTFCVSDQTFRSFCKWVPLMLAEPREVIADARRQAGEERAISDHAPLDQAAKFSADARAFASAQPAAVAAPSQRAPSPRNALAGSACALTGTALLAWIMLSHPPHRHTISESSSAKTVTVDRGALLTQSGPASAVAVQQEAVSQAVSVSAPEIASSPANVAVDSGNAKPAASHKPAHVAARNDRIPSAIGSTIATQASPKPSAAGSYSPFVPAQPGVDKYTSVTMSAATPVRAVSQPPRSASATESSGTSDTEWMSHLSQRRVTEIPDQFSK